MRATSRIASGRGYHIAVGAGAVAGYAAGAIGGAALMAAFGVAVLLVACINAFVIPGSVPPWPLPELSGVLVTAPKVSRCQIPRAGAPLATSKW